MKYEANKATLMALKNLYAICVSRGVRLGLDDGGPVLEDARAAINDIEIALGLVATRMRFCEFTGDDKHGWDEAGYKRKCSYVGAHYCAKHTAPLSEYQGWRVCCEECTTPVQIKTINKE